MEMTRRGFAAAAGAALAAFGARGACGAAGKADGAKGWKVAINPSTIRGYKLPLEEQVKLSIAAGYDGIEPWLSDMAAAKARGTLGDVRKRCEDAGFKVVSGIGFAKWAATDRAERAKGLETMKRDMELMAELGGAYVAAPPFGLQTPGSEKVALADFTERFEAVIELGKRTGVAPLLEFWGHSANLSTLGEALQVAAGCRGRAMVLADVYHMHRGGSSWQGLRFLTAGTLPVLHVNDVPAGRAAASLKDADRVWPGDGCAPWREIFGTFRENGMKPWLSLELFNPGYWKTTPEETLATGLGKVRGVLSC